MQGSRWEEESTMYECERLFGMSRGLEIQELVEKATGCPCPCKTGDRCILEPPVSAPATEQVAATHLPLLGLAIYMPGLFG